MASLAQRTLLLWVLLPLVIYFFGHLMLVRPAQRQVTLAQQLLLDAEREELAAEVGLARADRAKQRLEHEVQELAETAERMRTAERVAEAQLGTRAERLEWVLPGQGRLESRSRL